VIYKASKEPIGYTLTEARIRLFRLVEDVLAGRSDSIALSHRGHDEEVLLIRASDVERMRSELAILRKRVGPPPRPLLGMGRIVGAPGNVLAEARLLQNERFDAKLREISGDDTVANRQTTAVSKRGRGRPKPKRGGS